MLTTRVASMPETDLPSTPAYQGKWGYVSRWSCRHDDYRRKRKEDVHTYSRHERIVAGSEQRNNRNGYARWRSDQNRVGHVHWSVHQRNASPYSARLRCPHAVHLYHYRPTVRKYTRRHVPVQWDSGASGTIHAVPWRVELPFGRI